MSKNKMAFVSGKTWTSDAVYKERFAFLFSTKSQPHKANWCFKMSLVFRDVASQSLKLFAIWKALPVSWLKFTCPRFRFESLKKIFVFGKCYDRSVAQIFCPRFRFAKLENLRNLESAMTVFLAQIIPDFAFHSLQIFAIWIAQWPFLGSDYLSEISLR